jgi:hypothetical protein
VRHRSRQDNNGLNDHGGFSVAGFVRVGVATVVGAGHGLRMLIPKQKECGFDCKTLKSVQLVLFLSPHWIQSRGPERPA